MPRYGERREDGRIWDGGWRTTEQFERRKAQNRERKRAPKELEARRQRSKRERTNPEKRELVLERQRHYYHANKDNECKRRAEWRRNNKERSNEYQRAYYSENKPSLLPRILKNRLRRNPLIGIKSIIDRLKRGEGEFNKDLERVFETLAELCQRDDEG